MTGAGTRVGTVAETATATGPWVLLPTFVSVNNRDVLFLCVFVFEILAACSLQESAARADGVNWPYRSELQFRCYV